MHQPMGDKMELPNRLWSNKWKIQSLAERDIFEDVYNNEGQPRSSKLKSYLIN